jgi:hypothetical protein
MLVGLLQTLLRPNDLPRFPALSAARYMGVDQGTLIAWAGALAGFRRHFVIQGSYSPGVQSTNGFPEGLCHVLRCYGCLD